MCALPSPCIVIAAKSLQIRLKCGKIAANSLILSDYWSRCVLRTDLGFRETKCEGMPPLGTRSLPVANMCVGDDDNDDGVSKR